MKRRGKESGFTAGIVLAAAVCAAVLLFGLMIPALRPLAIQLGNAASLAFLAGGIGVAVYAAWRIVTFPARSRKVAPLARPGRHV